MKRRDFLKVAATFAGSTVLNYSGNLYALNSNVQNTNTKLLVVMLRGAYDAANFLVPIDSDDYYSARPNISVAKPNNGDDSAIFLNSQYGLHPAARAIHNLYIQKQAIFIPFSGNSTAPRSHFEAQDLMEAGLAPDSRLNSSSGYLGRLMEVLSSSKSSLGAISFTSNLPITFKGKISVPNIAGGLGKPVDPRSDKMMRDLYKGSNLESFANQNLSTRERVAREMNSMELDQEMKVADRGAAPASGGLSNVFKGIAKVMKVDPLASIGFVDVGGWDTHVNEGGSKGQLAQKLAALSDALAAYSEGMGERWRDTVVLVMSEFGRTFKENGNRGTDHGHGTTLWVLGGSINGGKIAGRQEKVSFSNLNESRDFKVLNDYRQVTTNILSKMYALNAKDLDYILPGTNKLNLDLL